LVGVCGAADFLNKKKYAFMVDGHDIKVNLYSTTGPSSRERLKWDGASFANQKMHDRGDLLYATRHFKAMNYHDNVFALLGMAQGVDNAVVDYLHSLKDLFTKVARHLYTHPALRPGASPLRSLSEAEHSGDDIDTEFPSCVPQWHISRITRRINSYTVEFEAVGKGTTNVLPILPSVPYLLQIGEFTVGEVEHAVQIDPLYDWASNKAAWWDLLVSIRNLATEWDTGYPTGEDIMMFFQESLL
jgi:hypothetical protein